MEKKKIQIKHEVAIIIYWKKDDENLNIIAYILFLALLVYSQSVNLVCLYDSTIQMARLCTHRLRIRVWTLKRTGNGVSE